MLVINRFFDNLPSKYINLFSYLDTSFVFLPTKEVSSSYNNMLNIAIVEDEKETRENILDCLNRFMSEGKIIYQVKEFTSAESFCFGKVTPFDIVLMDINLPGQNGYETVKKMREQGDYAIVIFITSLAQYAIKGYEVDALDFIIKPLNYYSFSLKMQRALHAVNRRIDETILVKNKTQMKFIKIQDIYYVEISSHTITYHTKDGLFITTGTIKKICDQLEKYHFSLCNRCYLVNIHYVTYVEGMSVQVGEEKLMISRPRRKEFLEDLNKYFSGHAGE